ncbi:MAG: Holliday junction resolvase RuvX [Eubacterium sp.]|nr:Holliday junction resolvase RuvX [Eubacterium sp.]
MRILGLDYGAKTVGVAVSDSLMLTATGVGIIRRKAENKLRQTLAEIADLINRYEVEEVVLGLPLNMDGSRGERAEKTLEFRDKLARRTNVKIILVDERLTTVEADELLETRGIYGKDRKQYVDEIAAEIILQDYLNSRYEGR